MNSSRAEEIQYNRLRKEIENTIRNKDISNHIYHSTNHIVRMLNAMIETDGKNWATYVMNDKGEPLLTLEEQQQFTEAFQNHMDTILSFLGKERRQEGGSEYIPTASELSGLPTTFLETKAKQVTKAEDDNVGIDDLYEKFVERIRYMDQVVNDYASKYGVLRLEKEHDLQPDIRMIPEPAAIAISQGVMGLSTVAGFPITSDVTMNVLSKIKVPYRTILFVIYMALDLTRLSMGLTGRETGRKILSILLSILELLRGDWKKATLTFIGYYGTTPLLYGQLGKIFLTAFRMFSPQLQDNFIFGSLDATKSFIIGILLSIFQVTAPEEVRLPLMASLEKIALRKKGMDENLMDAKLSPRPDYLSPTFEDLNNIQAVMNDTVYICSCEFEDLLNTLDKTPIIRLVLQLLRIPISRKMKENKCGKGPCKPFVKEVVHEAMERKNQESQSQQTPLTQIARVNNQRGGRVLHTIGKFKLKKNNNESDCQNKNYIGCMK